MSKYLIHLAIDNTNLYSHCLFSVLTWCEFKCNFYILVICFIGAICCYEWVSDWLEIRFTCPDVPVYWRLFARKVKYSSPSVNIFSVLIIGTFWSVRKLTVCVSSVQSEKHFQHEKHFPLGIHGYAKLWSWCFPLMPSILINCDTSQNHVISCTFRWCNEKNIIWLYKSCLYVAQVVFTRGNHLKILCKHRDISLSWFT